MVSTFLRSRHCLLKILEEDVKALRISHAFATRVSKSVIPDYYDIVKDPVDLSLIAQRLASGTYYAQLEIFAADFKRMFDNCCLYNAPDTIYAKCARRLESFFEHMIMSGVSFT